MIDWNAVNTLLQVLHGAATAGPKYNPVIAMAEADLASVLYSVKSVETQVQAELPPDSINPTTTPEEPPHGA